ncbi:MAG: RNA helicase [Caeruleum heppii]|nr:MAG: RNA helicase [Caeruleum heppii]
MTLSPRVSQGSVKLAQGRKPSKSPSNSPFGAMNRRSAGSHGPPERTSQVRPSRSNAEGTRHDSKRKGAQSDFKALKMQRALSPVSYSHRSSVKSRISDVDSFAQFEFLPILRSSISSQALPGLEDVSPTPVQRVAIPELLGGKSGSVTYQSTDVGSPSMQQYLLAAETGSGKTLAYLLPTIDAIKRAEDHEERIQSQARIKKELRAEPNVFELDSPPLSNEAHPNSGRPRAIILLPTSELVTQVGKLVKSLSHTVKFRAALISSAYTGRVIRNRLFSPGGVDVLISTPHLLGSIAESDPNILSRVTHLIVDEADSLLDRSFAPTTSAIIDRASPSLQQLILCSATIPRSLDTYLRRRFPDMRRLVTPNLHAIPRRVQLGVVDVEKDPYRGNRLLACADTIWNIGKMANEHAVSHGDVPDVEGVVKRVLVFVNERERADEVADYLNSKGIDAAALSRDTPERRTSEILSGFTAASPPPITSPSQGQSSSIGASKGATINYVPTNQVLASSRRHSPNTKVLVMTDLGSRGIDTLAVRHVVLYDVPHTTVDFIHRLGRTGRMGRRGRGVVLVGKNDRRDVVREVRDGMFKGQALI